MTEDRVTICLLLLPSPPSELSFSSIQAAYGPDINDALRFTQRTILDESNRQILQLDVAIICHDLLSSRTRPRGCYFIEVQRLMGLLYQLVEITAIKNRSAQNNEVFRYSIFPVQRFLNEPQAVAGSEGPLYTLPTLARHHRAATLLVGEGEVVDQLRRDFLRLRNDISIPHVVRVSSGLVMRYSDKQSLRSNCMAKEAPKSHYVVAVGGTFDHLHAGHKLLLTATAFLLEPNYDDEAAQTRCLIVGITGDALLKNKQFAEQMESWETREERTSSFLLSILQIGGQDQAGTTRLPRDNMNRRAVHHTLASGLTVKCVEILDAFGPTITDESITALVLSGETRSGGSAVNDKRLEKGWPLLETFEVDVLDQSEDDKDFGKVMQDFRGKISSTDIRRRLHEQVKSSHSMASCR